MRNPFRYFNSSPEVIRLVVMMYVRYPLSLRQVEDLLFERGVCTENLNPDVVVMKSAKDRV
jgi:transposase-like protein